MYKTIFKKKRVFCLCPPIFIELENNLSKVTSKVSSLEMLLTIDRVSVAQSSQDLAVWISGPWTDESTPDFLAPEYIWRKSLVGI